MAEWILPLFQMIIIARFVVAVLIFKWTKSNLSRPCLNNKQQHHSLVGLITARLEKHPICFLGSFYQNIRMRYDECLVPDEWYSWIPFNWWLLSPLAITLANDVERSNNIICLFYRKPNQPVLIINAFWFCVFIAHCKLSHFMVYNLYCKWASVQ